MGFKSDQLKLFGIKECREVGDPENGPREPRLSAPQSYQSTAASAAGIHATFFCGGFSSEAEADAEREGAHSPC